MDIDSAINTHNEEQLQLEETDDYYEVDFTEIVPLANTDHTYAVECISDDWLTEVKQENLAIVKQEPDDDVCFAI